MNPSRRSARTIGGAASVPSRREVLKGALVTLIASSCGLGPRGRMPSVVLVLIDQLRKDVADRCCTRMNALARDGVRMEMMRSVAPWTYPSVISLVSGLYPQQHGADGHITRDVLSTFDRRVPLLQRTLRRAGYQTAAFVTNPFLLDWNPFHQGFDRFTGNFVNNVGNLRVPATMWGQERMFGDTVNAAVLKDLRDRRSTAPEFTYVHYIDVHGPWEGAPFAASYDAATRFVDERVAELYAFFSERYDGDLLFVVTADHGVALEDDERLGLGLPWRTSKLSPFDFNLRVPFLVLPGRRVPRGRTVGIPCSNVDFVPTALDWLGLPGAQALPGLSLLPAIRADAALGGDRPVYAKVSAFQRRADCLVSSGRKYVRFFDPESEREIARHVFEPARDPRETTSLGSEFGDVDAVLQRLAGTHGRIYPARFDDVRSDIRERLRALGYLQ